MEYSPPPLFRQGIPARARFIFFVLMALVFILVDGRFQALEGFRGLMLSFTRPVAEFASLPRVLFEDGRAYFVSKRDLREENERLTGENRLLLLSAARLRELEEENAHLRALVGAVPRTGGTTLTAEVLGRIADSFSRRIQINLGSKDGLLVGMPVLGPSGVIGQVSRTVMHLSEVTLITDPNQQIPVMNERTGEPFIAQGTGEDTLDILFVHPNADLREGDRLVSSGLDQVFPRNIAVATVSKATFQPGETYRRVTAVPESKINELLFAAVVLVDPHPTAALDAQEKDDMRPRPRARSAKP